MSSNILDNSENKQPRDLDNTLKDVIYGKTSYGDGCSDYSDKSVSSVASQKDKLLPANNDETKNNCGSVRTTESVKASTTDTLSKVVTKAKEEVDFLIETTEVSSTKSDQSICSNSTISVHDDALNVQGPQKVENKQTSKVLEECHTILVDSLTANVKTTFNSCSKQHENTSQEEACINNIQSNTETDQSLPTMELVIPSEATTASKETRDNNDELKHSAITTISIPSNDTITSTSIRTKECDDASSTKQDDGKVDSGTELDTSKRNEQHVTSHVTEMLDLNSGQ